MVGRNFHLSDVGYNSSYGVSPIVSLKSEMIPEISGDIEPTTQINIEGQIVTLTRDNAPEYYGKVVTNYNQANATYRLFYIDFAGDFGAKGTVYLKADQVSTTFLDITASASSTTALEKMKQMNPMWAKVNVTADDSSEKAVLYLCDESKWTNYKDASKADYVIGAPSIEMYVKSYNAYHSYIGTIGYYKQLNCKWWYKGASEDVKSSGYMYTFGTSVNVSSYVGTTNDYTLLQDENNMYVKSKQNWWLASPAAYDKSVCVVFGGSFYLSGTIYQIGDYVRGICPLVSLKSDFIPEIQQ